MSERLDRINELARKSRAVGLTDEEKEEQQRLRAEYVAAVRKNAEMQLGNTYIVEPDGTKHPLKKKTQFLIGLEQ